MQAVAQLLADTLRTPRSLFDLTLDDFPVPRIKSRPIEPRKAAPVPVEGVNREVFVKIASETDEWKQAFALVSARYRDKGYVAAHREGTHFTPHHALPDTVTFVAKHESEVLATMSIVPDNDLLGLPMEAVYSDEIGALRRAGRRLNEVTCLADADLSFREFMPVFMGLCRLLVQYTMRQGSNDFVIEVNPRHVKFYRKIWGFEPIGPLRECSLVEGHPAEAFHMDIPLMKANAPKTYDYVYAEPLPQEALTASPMPAELARWFALRSTHTNLETVEDILAYVEAAGTPRRW